MERRSNRILPADRPWLKRGQQVDRRASGNPRESEPGTWALPRRMVLITMLQKNPPSTYHAAFPAVNGHGRGQVG